MDSQVSRWERADLPGNLTNCNRGDGALILMMLMFMFMMLMFMLIFMLVMVMIKVIKMIDIMMMNNSFSISAT